MPDYTGYLNNLGQSYNTPGTKGPISNTSMFGNWINSNNAYPSSGRSTGMVGGGPNPSLGPGGGATSLPAATQGNPLSMFGNIPQQALDRIGNMFAGKLPAGVASLLQQQQAQQAFASGMPGSNMQGGTFGGNAALRNTRDIALQLGNQAQNDWLSTLGAYAGNVFPTANASLQSGTQRDIANLEAQLARERMQQEGSQFGQELGFKYKNLASDDAYRQGQLGIQGGQLGLDSQRLKQQADQFQQNFGQQERQLANNLGISQQELALKLAQLNATNAYNTNQQDLLAQQQQFNQANSLWNMLGAGGVNNGNIDQFLRLLGGGGAPMATQKQINKFLPH